MTQHTDGTGLDRALAAGTRFTQPQVLAIAHSVLTNLAQAHQSGRVSGAVGPGNVVLGVDGSVGLVDVGGSPSQAYVSPEVLTGQQPTPASDVYAAAALLAHLARGSLTLPPTAADLDPTLGWLLAPALRIEPSARPTAAEMVAAVEQAAVPRYGADWRRAAGLGALVTGTGAAATGVALAGGTSAAAASGASGGGLAGGAAAAGAAGSGALGAGAGGSAAGASGGVGSTAAAAQGAAAQGAAAQGAAAQGAAAQGAAAQGAAAHSAQVTAAQGGAQTAGHGAGHTTAGGLSKGLLVKAGAGVGAGVVGVTTAVVLLTDGGSTEKHELPGTADIYLAGAPDGVAETMSAPGTKPIRIELDGAGKVTFPKVSGELGACSGCEPEPVDGGSISFPSTELTALNGISGVIHEERTLFAVGVFLGDGDPSQDGQVDLTNADGEQTQEPAVGEVFFIGDGRTRDGDLQEVVVPDRAETLFVGFADGYGFQGTPGAYDDNSGTVDIEVTLD